MASGALSRFPEGNNAPQNGITPMPRLAVPRVLVAEDEVTVAMLIEDMISELHYEVTAVVSRLGDAMHLLDTDSFDLALLDVHLEGETIFPFAAELERRQIPFLFATAYGPRGIPPEFRDYLVLQKPFGPVELRCALMMMAPAPRD